MDRHPRRHDGGREDAKLTDDGLAPSAGDEPSFSPASFTSWASKTRSTGGESTAAARSASSSPPATCSRPRFTAALTATDEVDGNNHRGAVAALVEALRCDAAKNRDGVKAKEGRSSPTPPRGRALFECVSQSPSINQIHRQTLDLLRLRHGPVRGPRAAGRCSGALHPRGGGGGEAGLPRRRRRRARGSRRVPATSRRAEPFARAAQGEAAEGAAAAAVAARRRPRRLGGGATAAARGRRWRGCGGGAGSGGDGGGCGRCGRCGEGGVDGGGGAGGERQQRREWWRRRPGRRGRRRRRGRGSAMPAVGAVGAVRTESEVDPAAVVALAVAGKRMLWCEFRACPFAHAS